VLTDVRLDQALVLGVGDLALVARGEGHIAATVRRVSDQPFESGVCTESQAICQKTIDKSQATGVCAEPQEQHLD